MLDKLGAILVAEIGSLTTRVTLVDTVAGETRLIGQAETATSSEPPYQNVLLAILEAISQIAAATGRELLRGDQIFMPQNNERDGVNHFVAVSSAAGNLKLLVAAIASDVSAVSAQRACQSTYTSILQVFTLDDPRSGESQPTQAPLVTAPKQKTVAKQPQTTWLEDQIATMLTLQPDAILLAGGLEEGTTDTPTRLAHIVAFTMLPATVEISGPTTAKSKVLPIIYAGNSQAQEQVKKACGERAKPIIVPNLRPSLDQEVLEPTRQEFVRLYAEQILPKLPGLTGVQNLSRIPITTVCQAEGLITRFLAKHYQRQILTLDIGSASSSAFLASPENYQAAILGTCGTGYGITTLLQPEQGLAKIARWLPFSISPQDLTHWLLNKLLRPHLVPASPEDLLLEHAVVRELITQVMAALAAGQAAINYDCIIAGGGVLAHTASPGLALLTLLDALQPTAAENTMALDIFLDALSLLPASGALAQSSAQAAVTLIERDLLNNYPLATCIIALGNGKVGQVALEAELIRTTPRGTASPHPREERIEVRHGEIVRLPLDQGSKGQLILRPKGGVRIGRNGPGVEVSADAAAINGSALGIVIDARGRPLGLPEDEKKRQELLRKWLTALSGEQSGQAIPAPTAVPLAPRKPPDASASSATAGALGGNQMPSAAPVPEPTRVPALPPLQPAVAPAAPAVPPPPLVDLGAETKLKPGSRVSLDDLRKQETAQPPAAITNAARPGSRISLDDLRKQELGAVTPSKAPATDLASDLAKLRQAAQEEEKPKKWGLFGGGKKKK